MPCKTTPPTHPNMQRLFTDRCKKLGTLTGMEVLGGENGVHRPCPSKRLQTMLCIKAAEDVNLKSHPNAQTRCKQSTADG